MVLSDHLNLLHYIIKKDEEGIVHYLKQDGFDAEGLKRFADKHHLSGNLYLTLVNSRSKDLFSTELVEYFKNAYVQQWVKNERFLKEIEYLADFFAGRGQEVIFLKGHFLAQRFYGDIDRRAIWDIDILVKKEALESCNRLLAEIGYKRTSIALFNARVSSYFTHHFEYRKDNIDLELHWLLANHPSFNLNYEKLWKEKQKFVFRNKTFHILSDEYELVLQILSVFKDIQLSTIIFKPFMDIYTMLKAVDKNINWREFFDNRRKEGLFLVSLNVLDLVLNVLNCRSDFTELSQYIERARDRVKYRELDKQLKLLDHPHPTLKNKLWGFGLYQAPLFKSFCWWGISLPFRMAVYRK